MDELTKKEKDFAQEYAKTGNGVQSALKTYDTDSYKTASTIADSNLDKPRVQNYIKSIAEQIPDELLLKVHLEGLQASDRALVDGNEIEIPDYAVRHKYLDTALKLKKLYETDEQKNINVLMPVLVKFLNNKDDRSDNRNSK